MECKTSNLARIRSRVSYKEYVELTALLNSEPSLEELATWFYRKLDRRHAYGSETNVTYAFESLEQFLKDYNARAKIRIIPVSGLVRVTMKEVVSKWLPEGKKCPECNWETETLYSFAENDTDEEGLCATCFIEMILETGMKILKQDAEICSECGKSVAPGSGRFVNRISDCNSYE